MSEAEQPRQGGRITLPVDVRAAERAYIHGRRTAGGVAHDAPLVGLAFSGGGIRSATFCLGVLQTLGKSGLLRAVDYLSTVSGGGYIGSCLSSYLSHHEGDRATDAGAGTPDGPKPWPAGKRGMYGTGPGELPFDQPDPIHHLRTHGDFLILRNSLFGRDVLRVIGILGSGLFASLTLFASFALAIVALVNAYLFAFGGDALWQLLGPGESKRHDGVQSALIPAATSSWLVELALVAGLGALFAALTWIVQVWMPPQGGAAPGETGSDRAERLRLQRTGLSLVLGVVALAFYLPYADVSLPLAHLAAAPPELRIAPHGAHCLWLPVTFCLGFALTGVVLYVSLLPRALKRAWTLRGRSILGATVGIGLYGTALAAVLAIVPLALWRAESMFHEISLTTVASLFVTRVFAGSEKPAQNALAQQLAALAKRAALALVVPVFLAASFVLISRGLLDHVTFEGPGAGPLAGRGAIFVWLLCGIAAVALCGFAVDFNRVSPHYFYRDRLSEAYLRSERRDSGGLQLYRDDSYMRLRELHGRAQGDRPSLLPPAPVDLRTSEAPPDLARYFTQPLQALRSAFKREQQQQAQVEKLRDDLREGYQQLRELREQPPEQARPRYATWGADQYELARSAWGIVENQSPYHLIVTALNLAGSRDLARRDLKSDHFVLSRLYCGSSTTGYVPTDHYNQGQTRLAQALTISGAAASAAMGAYTFFAQAFAMTLFNIRLGYWLPNPNRYPTVVPKVPGAAPDAENEASIRGGLLAKLRRFFRNRGFFWPRHLLIEMFSQTDARGALVNLSDGGHTADNVALYPLLQRRCELMIVCDAGCDPQYTCADLAAALRQIFVDENVVSQIDTADVVAQGSSVDARSRAHFAIGEVTYPQVEGDPDGLVAKGYLIYLKSSLTDGQRSEREPLAVRAYKATSPDFPHESTADQFFSDDQFEAYRSLGQHATGTLIAHLRTAGLGGSAHASQIWTRVLEALPAAIREQLAPAPREVTTSDVQELAQTGTG